MTTVTIQYDESNKAIKKALELIRALGAKITHKKEDPTIMTQEELDAKILSAQKQHEEGTCASFTSSADLNNFLQSL
ncbi:MAG: hypothetical protein Q4D33_13680 [Prevotellaceae bacterium]|nr:hypothetical protein [Prevotellaceae bacterium]